MDSLGKQIIPFEYDFIQSFSRDGYTQYAKNGEYGIMDKNQKIIFHTADESMIEYNSKYGENSVTFDQNGITEIKLNDKVNYIDKNGNFVWKSL